MVEMIFLGQTASRVSNIRIKLNKIHAISGE